MNIKLFTYTHSDQIEVKDFILSQWEEFGFSYKKEYDYDLDDPQRYYLEKGGMFYILKDQNKIIGTMAIINKGNNIAELKRLYVDNNYRGRKLGSMLVDTSLQWCQEHGFNKVEFETNKKFEKAHLLYVRRGFKIVREDDQSFYMEKYL